jgi:hypothetical protein
MVSMFCRSTSHKYAAVAVLLALAACGGGAATSSNIGGVPAPAPAPAPAPVSSNNAVSIDQLNTCPFGTFNNLNGSTSNTWECIVGRYVGVTLDGSSLPCTLEIASSGLITGTQGAVVTSFQFLVFTLSKRPLGQDALRNRVDYSLVFSFSGDINGETIGLIGAMSASPTPSGGLQEELRSGITRGLVGGTTSTPFSCQVLVP